MMSKTKNLTNLRNLNIKKKIKFHSQKLRLSQIEIIEDPQHDYTYWLLFNLIEEI